MFSHEKVWSAIDRLAELRGMSVSGLARAAGLDPTTFNRSKRFGGDGRPRWPSTESLAKVFLAANADLQEFVRLVDPSGPERGGASRRSVPLIGLAQAGSGGFFGDNGLPQGEGWDAIEFPTGRNAELFAIEVQGDSMLPLYRDGDVLIVEPAAEIRKGDRVVVRTRDGEVLAKVLSRRTGRTVELTSLNPAYPDRQIEVVDLAWMARIVWASQ